MGHRHANASVAAGNAEGLPGVFLPGCSMHADRFVGADAHCVGHSMHHVGATTHRCRTVFGVDLAIEDRCWS